MKIITQISTYLPTLLLGLVGSLPLQAQEASEPSPFQAWLEDLRLEALDDGVSASTLDSVFPTIEEPVERVVELDRSQPEFMQTFAGYMHNRISDARIARGQALLDEHSELFARIQAEYGVQPHYLVSFWALESNFGDFTGGFSVINALATLAYDPRRSDFFRQELITALHIIDQGHIAHADMTGSWAGAMGQCQFMPSTFQHYAVDGDGDGRIDIWNSLPDVFASAGNFLSQSGWRGDERWGREVVLPEGFDYSLAGGNVRKSVAEWNAMGITRIDGSPLGNIEDMQGTLLLPAGANGPAFIGYNNFRTTLVWNRSNNYAISVGHLADRFAGGGPIVNMGEEERAMTRAEVIEIQEMLNELGHNAGQADGIPGSQTRSAIRAFQTESGLPSDGHASHDLLTMLRLVVLSE